MGKYDDIINLPHHISKKYPKMTMEARSAQFAPFSALTGYEDQVKETARLTSEQIELDEEAKSILDGKLQLIQDQIRINPQVTITYFIPDTKKQGGKYVTIDGNVKKIDEYMKMLYLEDGTQIPIIEILDILYKF